MEFGLYEQIINQTIQNKLSKLDSNVYYIGEKSFDKADASRILSHYLSNIIKSALNSFKGTDSIQKQIQLSNKIISFLHKELKDNLIEKDLIVSEAKILEAILKKINFAHSDFQKYLKEVIPYSGLSYSELFTGNNAGISLESEIKKEILSSNRIMWLVSFIKWTGIRIFEKELIDFTDNGGELKIITTTYIGATDQKAIEFLSSLKNTEVKISYNTDNERLQAKAYLFFRDTGFHTGYIGSSNISRSALTNGLEWNIKITTQEVSQIIEKFYKTFETYWEDKEFELFNGCLHKEKLRLALRKEKIYDKNDYAAYFDLKPYPFQEEILEKLKTERLIHNHYRNLIVAATGTGKTVVSGFDYKSFRKDNKSSKLLFIAHRKEILQQAQATFRGIIRDNNFGELWVDGMEPENYSYVFASVQTLNNRLRNLDLSETFYDYIVVDEVHHIPASSYREIINYFKPKILLGLTATPERMDNSDILIDFCNTIAAEIRLPEALNRRLLCPFQYFGITDNVDLSKVQWVRGRYAPGELSNIYTRNDFRVSEIINTLDKYLTDLHCVRALGFCVTQEHAEFMSRRFNERGFKSDYLVSNNHDNREEIRKKLVNKEINYLFVVDIFNEGIDIPEIDTVLFLRPTESLTVFLQQFGRGLRLADGKECLTVFDFVSNARPEYDYEGKFRALIGKTNTSTIKEIQADFPHLPVGCSIQLERVAKDRIVENISNATLSRRTHLLQKIRNYPHQTGLPLTLKNFISFTHLPLQQIYKHGVWSRLCVQANQENDFAAKYEKDIYRAISNKWLSCSSFTYFSFLKQLAKKNFKINLNELNKNEKLMCTMLYYDVWQEANKFKSLEEGIKAIGENDILVKEIVELLEILLNRIDFIESDISLPYSQPLKLHARYTRDQILSAFQFNSFIKKSSNREGVAENKELNTELLFIDLVKSEEDFSPSTLYDDYAIDDVTFHWQSQNSTSETTSKGKSYIMHREINKNILLFVREKNTDEYKNTMAYVFLGSANYIEHTGSKPMNIKWKLEEPMPPYLWKDTVKMAVG